MYKFVCLMEKLRKIKNKLRWHDSTKKSGTNSTCHKMYIFYFSKKTLREKKKSSNDEKKVWNNLSPECVFSTLNEGKHLRQGTASNLYDHCK